MELKGIGVSFGSLRVLEEVDFSIRTGEVHAIVGEHGAGKSSIARIMAGLLAPDEGQVFWKGKLCPSDIKISTLNVEFVTQETELFRYQSVAYNLFTNRHSAFPGFFFSPKRINERADTYLRSIGVSLPAKALVGELSLPERVLLDVVRHLQFEPELLILDEALEKLTSFDLMKIRALLRTLTSQGKSILFITHRIDDIYEFADRVTIVREGRVLITDEVGNIDKVSLIKLAYTQVMENYKARDVTREFYQFLKYNEAILERLPVSLIVIDRSETIKLMNRQAQDFFRTDGANPMNAHLSELFSSGNAEVLASLMTVLLERKAESFYNVCLKTPSGERTVDMVVYPILDGNLYIGSMIILSDMTEYRKLRERIVLSEKLASLGILSAGVAHEINNPLETIYNYLDFLKLKIADSKLSTVLTSVEEEVSSIEHIVSNLIAFSDDRAPETERIDLEELVVTIVALSRKNAEQRKTHLVLETMGRPMYILANKLEIKQVVLNLMRNGFDAMDGGIMTIILDEENKDDTKWMRLSIADTGLGIPREAMGSIFLPFFSTKSGFSGHMGLGLSICYGIVNKFQGSIHAENLEPHGCRLTVSFPGA